MATRKTTKTKPSWSDVKTKLADFDRAALLGLVQDLYAANQENKVFLHARFQLGDDPLEHYQDVITGWINPPDYCSPISVSKAKKAISDYKKAVGQPKGLAELTVFYCEESFNLLGVGGMEDAGFYDALIRMFEQALKYTLALPKAQQTKFLARLEQLRQLAQDVGWGVAEDIEGFWLKADLTA